MSKQQMANTQARRRCYKQRIYSRLTTRIVNNFRLSYKWMATTEQKKKPATHTLWNEQQQKPGSHAYCAHFLRRFYRFFIHFVSLIKWRSFLVNQVNRIKSQIIRWTAGKREMSTKLIRGSSSWQTIWNGWKRNQTDWIRSNYGVMRTKCKKVWLSPPPAVVSRFLSEIIRSYSR